MNDKSRPKRETAEDTDPSYKGAEATIADIAHLLKKSEDKRVEIVRRELEESRKSLGTLSLERLSHFTESQLRNLDARIARYRELLQQQGVSASTKRRSRSGLSQASYECEPFVSQASLGVTPRARIDAFISKVEGIGHKVKRKDIWSVAGYTNATEFERFQRNDPRTTKSAAKAFNRVLRNTPEEFVRSLRKKQANQLSP